MLRTESSNNNAMQQVGAKNKKSGNVSKPLGKRQQSPEATSSRWPFAFHTNLNPFQKYGQSPQRTHTTQTAGGDPPAYNYNSNYNPLRWFPGTPTQKNRTNADANKKPISSKKPKNNSDGANHVSSNAKPPINQNARTIDGSKKAFTDAKTSNTTAEMSSAKTHETKRTSASTDGRTTMQSTDLNVKEAKFDASTKKSNEKKNNMVQVKNKPALVDTKISRTGIAIQASQDKTMQAGISRTTPRTMRTKKKHALIDALPSMGSGNKSPKLFPGSKTSKSSVVETNQEMDGSKQSTYLETGVPRFVSKTKTLLLSDIKTPKATNDVRKSTDFEKGVPKLQDSKKSSISTGVGMTQAKNISISETENVKQVTIDGKIVTAAESMVQNTLSQNSSSNKIEPRTSAEFFSEGVSSVLTKESVSEPDLTDERAKVQQTCDLEIRKNPRKNVSQSYNVVRVFTF